MSEAYQIVFSLKFTHEYYQNSICKDFTCVPTKSADRLMKRHKLIFRPKEDGFQVLGKFGNNNKPLIPIELNTNFGFVFELKNPQFLNFTEFDWERGKLIYYRQKGKTTPLISQVVNQIYRGQFPYQFFDENLTELNIEVQDRFKKGVFKTLLDSEDGNFTSSLNLSSLPTGKYDVLTMDLADVVLRKQRIYVNNEAFGSKIFGHIDLKYNEVKDFTVDFEPRSKVWSYYVNSKLDLGDKILGLYYRDNSANGRYFGLDIPFVEQENDLDTEDTLLFKSGELNNNNEFVPQEIPIYEDQLKNLQLMKHKENKPIEDGTALILSLPKPSVNNLKPELFIYI